MGRLTQYVFDDLGRPVTTTSPDPGYGQLTPLTENIYDEDGRLWKTVRTDTTRAHEITTLYQYDSLGRTWKVTEDNSGLNARVEYVYDLFGRMAATSDPLQRITSTRYDCRSSNGIVLSLNCPGAAGVSAENPIVSCDLSNRLGRAAAGTRHGIMYVWEVTTGKLKFARRVCREGIVDLRFSSDDKTLCVLTKRPHID